ncbi:MAG: alpha/beta hydrolase fold domain-containing protein [Acidimicrobiales bacterium]
MALLFQLMLLGGCTRASLAGTTRQLTYCAGGPSGTLKLYEPDPAPTHPVPAVVFLHAGGWILGDATVGAGTLAGDVESAIVNQGWLFVSLNYALAPSFKWPAQIQDVKCAVRYLRANAGLLHIAPFQIGAMGASAGGQLVSLMGLAGPSAGFDVGPFLNESSAVASVVDEYGPTDLNAPSWSTSDLAQGLSPLVFGVPPQPPSPVLTAASPVTYVTGTPAPPFLIIQGAEDNVVSPQQSIELAQHLQSTGHHVTLVMVRDAGHGLKQEGSAGISPSVSALAEEASSFLIRTLRAPVQN